MMMKKLMECLV